MTGRQPTINLINLINAILQSQHAATRLDAEQTLVNLGFSNPNELMLAYLQILVGNYEIKYRYFSASQLRICLSGFSYSEHSNLWDNLNHQTQNIIKTQLFEVIYAEKNNSMKRHIANTLASVAGSVLTNNKTAWPQFQTSIWKLFKDSSVSGMLSGFYILESFIEFYPSFFDSNFEAILFMFQNALECKNSQIKISALNAFTSFLKFSQEHNFKKFEKFVLNILCSVQSLFFQQKNGEGIQILSEMIDINPYLFRQNFKELFELLGKILLLKNLEYGVKMMVAQIMIGFIEKLPGKLRTNKGYLYALFRIIFNHMFEVDGKITKQWESPIQGYSKDMQEDENFETILFGMSSIDRIISAVGGNNALITLFSLINQTNKTITAASDWRIQHAIIMVLSQLGKHIVEERDLSVFMLYVPKVISHCDSPNPKLRYAACYAIGQISNDLHPKFQDVFDREAICKKLIQLLCDQVPRVVAGSADALAKFLKGMTYEQLEPFLDKLMELLVGHSNSGISLVRENCIRAICSVAEVCQKHFAKYREVTIQLLSSIIQPNIPNQYKQLRGRAIEAVAVVINSLGPEASRSDLQNFIPVMVYFLELNEQINPQKQYVLRGWRKLCHTFGKQLSQYLKIILPKVFGQVKNAINESINSNQNKDKSKKQGNQYISSVTNTQKTGETKDALEMLCFFIQQFEQNYYPFAEQTVALLLKVIEVHPNNEVRQQACQCLPSLVTVIKKGDLSSATNLAKLLIKTLVEDTERQANAFMILLKMKTLHQIIGSMDMIFLAQPEIEGLYRKMMIILSKGLMAKQVAVSLVADKADEEQDNQDVFSIFTQQISQQNQIQAAISNVLCQLFKTHKDMIKPIFVHLVSQVLLPFVKSKSSKTQRFVIMLINGMIEHLGPQYLTHFWESFGKLLIKWSKNAINDRLAICDGLTSYARQTNDSTTIQACLTALLQASQINREEEQESANRFHKDSIAAAVGRIMIAHGQSFFNFAPYVERWFAFLPLRFNIEQAPVQHELLVNIMLSQPQMILGSNLENQIRNLVKVLKIYGVILGNPKLINENIKNKMKTSIKSIQQSSLFTENKSRISQYLSQKQMKNLDRLISN